jgi:hypothetical protein
MVATTGGDLQQPPNDGARRRTVLEIMAATHNPQPLGTAYLSKIRMFKKWVDDHPEGEVLQV